MGVADLTLEIVIRRDRRSSAHISLVNLAHRVAAVH